MQTDSTSQDRERGARLEPAFASWTCEPALASALQDRDGAYLVLDAADGRVLAASPAAAALAEAVRGLDGAGLARQIAGASDRDGGPRLVRLRLDPRRIAPPSLFTLARGTDADGAPVVLIVPAGPTALPRPRPAPIREPDRPEPEAAGSEGEATPHAPPPSPKAEGPQAGDRFLWRSDATGTLTAVDGAGGALAGLVGRDWAALLQTDEAGDAGGSEALAALGDRRTFRRLPARLRADGAVFAVELSGAPTAREGQGFAGFGVVRSVETPPAEAPVAPAEPAADLAGALPATPDEEPLVAAEEPAPSPPDPSLSLDEHAAFREIAKALGARYAGDDEARDGSARDRRGGSVTPFPGQQPDQPPAVAAPPADGSGFLEGLPVPALVHRGDAILAANRRLLDLARFADIDALRAAGIGALFAGGLPGGESGEASEAALLTGGGGSRPVEVLPGACEWGEGPAAILVLRALGEDDPRRALAAERLAREVQAGRALGAEAALDALQAGVVTIDGAGRVVALNRAAAAFFGASAREVVGGRFSSLFDAASAAALTDVLAGAGDASRTVSVDGRPVTLALAPRRADGNRVAVLHPSREAAAAAIAPTPPALETRGAHFLSRLDRELREPVNGILALTDTMLAERYGALGDPRYRACLADIRMSGERILERVGELRDLAAVEAGEIDLDPRPLALNDLVAGCVAVLQTEAARGRIVLRTSFSAGLAELEADEPSVRRAASLVIEQAIRRSTAGGHVIVSTGAGEAAEIALRVRDGGAAVRGSAVEDAPDDDLRLALPRALVQANGGSLRLSGRADEGTLVEILLPIRRGARG